MIVNSLYTYTCSHIKQLFVVICYVWFYTKILHFIPGFILQNTIICMQKFLTSIIIIFYRTLNCNVFIGFLYNFSEFTIQNEVMVF